MSFDLPSDSENDVPDWLKGLQPEEDPADFEPESAAVPSWMEDEEESDHAPAQGADAVPEWLANIRQAEKPVDEDEEPPPDTGSLSPEDKQDTANWLEKIRVQYARDTGQLEMPAEQPDASSGDYLERIQALKEKEQIHTDQPEPDAWLDGLMGDELPEPDADDSGWGMSAGELPVDAVPAGIWETEEKEETRADEGPDWLSGLPSIDTDMLIDENQEQDFSAGDAIPDWLKGMQPEGPPDQADIPTFTASDDQAPEWLGSRQPDQGEPDSPAELEQDAVTAAEAVDQEFPGLPDEPGVGSLPNWLENLKFSPDDSKPGTKGEAILPEDYSGEDVSSLLFEADDLPDWLSEEPPSELVEDDKPAPAPRASVIPEADEDIAPAELPSWLQAMRPIEAVTALVSEDAKETPEPGDQERVGPLAGLADVLPAEPHIVHFGTRTVPITGFQLSPAQKNYSLLLKAMVEAESAAPPVTRRQVALPQQFLRWIIGILLMLAVFIGTWAQSDRIQLPTTNLPAAESAVVDLIEGLSASSKVLIAFEYQPGFSGEMEAASEAVLHHLLMRGSNIAIISTQATGPGIAERFLKTKLNQYPQISQDQYTNHGYLSGGAAGLANFAASPSTAIAGSNVLDIREYALVLVITDDPDLARAWVEQVQPHLDPDQNGAGTPLVMIVSAQAEPLVYPYYLSNPRQVSGIVSGVVGGGIYEHMVTGLHGTANRYWFAYNLTLLIAIALIAGISLINLLGTIFRNLRKPKRQGNA